jgi:uncharacterized protein (TIGR02996 family)
MSQLHLDFPVPNAACLAWRSGSLQLTAVTGPVFREHGPPTRSVFLFDLARDLSGPVREWTVPSAGELLRALAVAAWHDRFLLVYDAALEVWDAAEPRPHASRALPRHVRGGGLFPDAARAWTLPEASSGSVDWGVWNPSRDEYREWPLERFDHYGRGAALHPSGLLIGACWNAYQCGYLIHEVAGGGMVSYARPAVVRDEYEAYLPAFSPDGTRFAFVCNQYTSGADLGVVCVHDLASGRELTAFSSGSRLGEVGLQFVNAGKDLAFAAEKAVKVRDPETGDLRETHETPGSVRALAGHPEAGLYAAAHERGLTVFGAALPRLPVGVGRGRAAAEEGFRRAIRDNPHDVAPRLVYADWLEERGDPCGELIRVQCALATTARAAAERFVAEHAVNRRPVSE